VIADGGAGATGGGLVAPHLLHVEVAHTLRRAVQLGRIGAESASLAHRDLVRLDVALVPYEAVAARVWELRETVRPYDAWYVAVAESFGHPLATLDVRLAAAPGPRCEFLTRG
jgi:predicted nucleic acid-binding protein